MGGPRLHRPLGGLRTDQLGGVCPAIVTKGRGSRTTWPSGPWSATASSGLSSGSCS